MIRKRSELRKGKYSSEETKAQYQQTNYEVRKSMMAVKEQWIENQCAAIERGLNTGSSKQAFINLKTSQKSPTVIEYKGDNFLTSNEKVRKR